MQTGLFTEKIISEPQISGLSYIPAYIDEAKEHELIKSIDSQTWLSDLKRRVQHYGYKYDYKARYITQSLNLGILPEWLSSYCHELYEKNIFSEMPDQVIINEYMPGQGISPHIDCIPCFKDTIASLSLSTDCIMEFSQPETGEKRSVFLERRSLIVLSDEARYKWQHSISARKSDRYNGQIINRSRRISLTFRKVILQTNG